MNMSSSYANQFTKEAIKARMMQHAANLWGVKKTSLLDPFVRLLMEAFSTEVYRVANETQNIEGRVLDKIARMLTPDLLTSPKPAHAIMQANPASSDYVLHPHTRFTVLKKTTQNTTGNIRNEEIGLSFSPTHSCRLIKGKLAVIANGHQLVSVDDTGFRHPLLRMNEALPWGHCWIGLKLDKNLHDLDNVSLYFDFSSYESTSWIYELLPLCKIYYKGQEVSTTHGRMYFDAPPEHLGEEIFKDYDLLHQLHEEVEQYYAHKYLTLSSCPLQREQEGYPELLEAHFKSNGLNSKVPQDLVWLEIRFPPNYNYEILGNCNISINTFPVSNRSLHTHIFSYKGLNGILPMRTAPHELFLSVFRVTDSRGRAYHEIPYTHSLQSKTGYYSVRYGGTERFDQRSAHDMVNYLLELTRDEVAAFSSLDQTFIRTSLENLSKQINQIQSKTIQLDKYIKHTPSYLVLEPIDTEENIQVEYWVTQGTEANNLRPGTELICQNNAEIDVKGAVLVSITIGGQPALQSGERMEVFKYAFSSRNRLVTKEDIRNFCRAELGGKMQKLTFHNGIALSDHPKQGYIRTLEVHITPHNIHELSMKEWDHIAATLLLKLKSLSPDNVNYKVFINP